MSSVSVVTCLEDTDYLIDLLLTRWARPAGRFSMWTRARRARDRDRASTYVTYVKSYVDTYTPTYSPRPTAHADTRARCPGGPAHRPGPDRVSGWPDHKCPAMPSCVGHVPAHVPVRPHHTQPPPAARMKPPMWGAPHMGVRDQPRVSYI